jgi:uncharacterized OB-fold protein
MSSTDTRTASAGLKVCKCAGCNALYFPTRLICHRCGGGTWTDEFVREGTIEESTRIIGENNSPDRLLATINAAGLHMIVRLTAPLPDGARVILEERNGAPWAAPAPIPNAD